MITGELKNKVDSIWDTIWTGGISSPITVLEHQDQKSGSECFEYSPSPAENRADGSIQCP